MGLEFEDHEVTKAEHDFYRAFVTILEHLKNRALKAEAEVRSLRRELETRREQVEFFGGSYANGGAAGVGRPSSGGGEPVVTQASDGPAT